MRIFAISDIHVDFAENFRWVRNLSHLDYQKDILILAGDLTDIISLFEKTLISLRGCFREIFFIPGNHDLWVPRSDVKDSLRKLQLIKTITAECGIRMELSHLSSLSIVPLFGWYDYSFGKPSREIIESWADFTACQWPPNYDEQRITQHLVAMNDPCIPEKNTKQRIISFSHFLPRIDIMPFYIPNEKRSLYPVLGTTRLEEQIRKLGSIIHVYGHSHVNHCVMKDNTLYLNNAFGYPYETQITSKKLKCILEI